MTLDPRQSRKKAVHRPAPPSNARPQLDIVAEERAPGHSGLTARAQAVESLTKVSEALPKAEDAFVPLLRRLATGDYNSTRIASAPLFATVYTRVGEASKAEMRQYAPTPPRRSPHRRPPWRARPRVTRRLQQRRGLAGLAAACNTRR